MSDNLKKTPAAAPLSPVRPVYPAYFADPFVLEHGGAYYAYGTGSGATGGRVFEVLRSSDLRHWVSLGGALEPPLAGGDTYWAPEVAHHEGKFYLYYSVGVGDKGHRIRVAVAALPQGPFADQDLELTPSLPFAIDGSPFRDHDGRWYLFYARDFLDGQRVGTALEVDRLEGMTRLAGQPRTVLRASGDWQMFQHSRPMYGQVYDWHTLEGPFVVRRGGRYYCFYSGGNWQNPSYGVSYAVAEHPLGPWTEPHQGAVVLRTQPGRLIGPGHNSLVVSPDGQDHIVFHAWDSELTARRMHIAPLLWTPEGPRVRLE